jgi:hypothetical protein
MDRSATVPGRSGHDSGGLTGSMATFPGHDHDRSWSATVKGRNEPMCCVLKKSSQKPKVCQKTKAPDSLHQHFTLHHPYPLLPTMKFSHGINTIFFFFFLALLGMATPSTATTTTTTTSAAADMAMATTVAEPTAAVANGGLRGGTAQEHRSLYGNCPYTTYIFCMSKCRSRLYKSIIQCKRENPACAPSSCC